MVWPQFSKNEIKLVTNILKSGKVNYWTGEYGRKLENSFSKLFRKKYSLAISNATIGLEYSLQALNLKNSDEVLVTPRSYFSSASCILKVKAKPVFCDIDIESQNISVESIKRNINKNTKAIIVVHLGGNSADIGEIKKITKKRNITLIEDCSQAHGAKYKGKLVGSFGDIAVWSFCNDKIISSGGEGGIVSLNDKKLYDKLWSYRDIGKNRQKYLRIKSKFYFQWIHDEIGSNFRMTELQSALALSQLKNLDKTIIKRKFIANAFINAMKKISWLKYVHDNDIYSSARYRLNISIDQKYVKGKFYAINIINLLNKNFYICNEGPCPLIFLEKGFKNRSYKAKNLKNSYYLINNNISILIDPTITKKDLKKTINEFTNVIQYFSKKIDYE